MLCVSCGRIITNNLKIMKWNIKQTGLIALTVFSFVACDEDDKKSEENNKQTEITGASTKTIILSDTSAYNSSNFVKSMERIYKILVYEDSISYQHTFKNGNLQTMVGSVNTHGKFGMKLTFTPVYNDKGIATDYGVKISPKSRQFLSFKVVFDKEGYIRYSINEDQDITTLTWNDKKQITETVQSYKYEDKISLDTTKYEYNNKGQLFKIVDYSYNELIYNDKGLLINRIYAEDVDGERSTYTYQYDTQDRLISKKNDGGYGSNYTYHYAKDSYTRKSFDDEYPDILEREEVYGIGRLPKSKTNYNYLTDGNKKVFRSKKVTDYNEKGHPTKESYFEGTLEKPVLVGYMDIELKEHTVDKTIVEGRVYTKDKKLLYIKTRTIIEKDDTDSTIIKDPNGKEVSDTNPDWVNELYLPHTEDL